MKGAPTHPAKENPDIASAIDLFDRWVPVAMHRNHDPGIAVGVVYQDELLWGKGYGLADIESKRPVTLDTRFRIASISKTFTATAVLQLRDAGKLCLEDPVAKHLDWFGLRYEDAPEVTIRNLLTHTSGLPRDSHESMWTACVAPEWEEFVGASRRRRLTRPPYEKFAYSNMGYSLLGGIITQVSGISWAGYVRENILKPLGMGATFPVPVEDDLELATGYYRVRDDYSRQAAPFFLMNAFEASANIASSVNDMARYAAFHLGNRDTPVLSRHSLCDMHRVHWLHPDWQGGYGLGSSIFRIGDWEISGHSGAYNGYACVFTMARKHNLSVIVLTNGVETDAKSYAVRAYKLILPEIIKATRPATPEPDPTWEKYLGNYVSCWGIDTVIIRDGRLQVVALDSPDSPPAILEPTDKPHTFTLQEEGQSNEEARFELDDDGNVVKLWVRNECADRSYD